MTQLRKKISETIYAYTAIESEEYVSDMTDQIIQAITELIEEAVGEDEKVYKGFKVERDSMEAKSIRNQFRAEIKSNLLKGVRGEWHK